MFYKERDEEKRQVFLELIRKIPKDEIIYLDESGIDEFIHREYGRALRGEKVYGEVSGKRYARESFIAAKRGSQIIAPFCFIGTCDTLLFNTWLEYVLKPHLHPGQSIVMDNASFHKSEATKSIIESAGCTLIFLPPYSPNLNPIELFWANLKAKVRKIINKFKTLSEAIDYAFYGY